MEKDIIHLKQLEESSIYLVISLILPLKHEQLTSTFNTAAKESAICIIRFFHLFKLSIYDFILSLILLLTHHPRAQIGCQIQYEMKWNYNFPPRVRTNLSHSIVVLCCSKIMRTTESSQLIYSWFRNALPWKGH